MSLKNFRASGILLHPTSLPSLYGIGDLGKSAYEFIDYLESAGQKLWQVLPLGPVGFGESPYSSSSSFAGNPLLIDLEQLLEAGWLSLKDISNTPDFSPHLVEFEKVKKWKLPLLDLAAEAFLKMATDNQMKQYQEFCRQHSYWLEDYVFYSAIKEYYEAQYPLGELIPTWTRLWEKELIKKDPKAVKKWKQICAYAIDKKRVVQYFFFLQWKQLKKYANQHGVYIIGDVPIFVSSDSADVWAHSNLFLVDELCVCKKVAGVPPDYFSPTGQRWGNPLYNWKAMKEEGYKWWIERFRVLSQLVDVVRIDHFRGFEAYYEIEAEHETAEKGCWVIGPGEDFFHVLQKELGELDIIAEDLGFITEKVHQLRKKFGFPGMKILQFAFEFDNEGNFNSRNGYLPHNYEDNCVVYTGTHDNDTTLGWYNAISNELKEIVQSYIDGSDYEIAHKAISLALSSVARFAIFPLQDLLGYGTDARMNTPSTVGGKNWRWRFTKEALSSEIANWMKQKTKLYNR